MRFLRDTLLRHSTPPITFYVNNIHVTESLPDLEALLPAYKSAKELALLMLQTLMVAAPEMFWADCLDD